MSVTYVSNGSNDSRCWKVNVWGKDAGLPPKQWHFVGGFATEEEGRKAEQKFKEGRNAPIQAKPRAQRTPHDNAVLVKREKNWREKGCECRTYVAGLYLDGKLFREKIGKTYDPAGPDPRIDEYLLTWDDVELLEEYPGDCEQELLKERAEWRVGNKETCRV